MPSIARSIHLVLAVLLVAGLVVQVFLAGLGVFRSAESFLTHRDWGYLLEVLPILLLVFGLVGRMGRRVVLLAAGIFVLFLLQSVFVLIRTNAPEVAALHPVNGFLILLLSIVLARDSWQGRRQASEAAGPSTATGTGSDAATSG
jgi:hypothetical protein